MITIGRHEFPTQRAAKTHFRALFARYSPGDTVTGLDHDDLMDLTILHPSSSIKMGVGIDRFRIVAAPCKKALAYEIVRTDGTVTDISYLKCICGDTAPEALVSRAFRMIVKPDVGENRSPYTKLKPIGDGEDE